MKANCNYYESLLRSQSQQWRNQKIYSEKAYAPSAPSQYKLISNNLINVFGFINIIQIGHLCIVFLNQFLHHYPFTVNPVCSQSCTINGLESIFLILGSGK